MSNDLARCSETCRHLTSSLLDLGYSVRDVVSLSKETTLLRGFLALCRARDMSKAEFARFGSGDSEQLVTELKPVDLLEEDWASLLFNKLGMASCPLKEVAQQKERAAKFCREVLLFDEHRVNYWHHRKLALIPTNGGTLDACELLALAEARISDCYVATRRSLILYALDALWASLDDIEAAYITVIDPRTFSRLGMPTVFKVGDSPSFGFMTSVPKNHKLKGYAVFCGSKVIQ